jgi:hypothetical protein
MEGTAIAEWSRMSPTSRFTWLLLALAITTSTAVLVGTRSSHETARRWIPGQRASMDRSMVGIPEPPGADRFRHRDAAPRWDTAARSPTLLRSARVPSTPTAVTMTRRPVLRIPERAPLRVRRPTLNAARGVQLDRSPTRPLLRASRPVMPASWRSPEPGIQAP